MGIDITDKLKKGIGMMTKKISKTMHYLNAQLETDKREEAEKCIAVYNKLIELNEGKVWSSQWETFVSVQFIGLQSDSRTFKLNAVGEVFLNGIK